MWKIEMSYSSILEEDDLKLRLMIGEFQLDYVVAKSTYDDHLDFSKKCFERMRSHQLNMNPLKCAFSVSTGNFLGFFVHKIGIETYQNKCRVIIEAKPPNNQKQLQRLLAKLIF